MKDALGHMKCETCKFNHQPHKQAPGVCIKSPPVPFVMGTAPTSAIVDPKNPGANVGIIIHGYYPPAVLGCAQYEMAPDDIRKLS